MMPYKQKTKLIFYTRNEVKHGFSLMLSLSKECIYMVFKGFQIEFHAGLKNELFVHGDHS